jgi:hypothetical protein
MLVVGNAEEPRWWRSGIADSADVADPPVFLSRNRLKTCKVDPIATLVKSHIINKFRQIAMIEF